VRQSVRMLGRYGKVMVAAYKETTGEVLDTDIRTLLDDTSIPRLYDLGLFCSRGASTTNASCRAPANRRSTTSRT